MLNIKDMTTKSIKSNESGFAAILVAMIILIIVSLISTALAQQMNALRLQSVSNELAAQASMAAQSGVNDAIHYINTSGASNISNKTTCINNSSQSNSYWSNDTFPNTLSGSISYSCLLVYSAVGNILLDGIQPGQYAMIPILNTPGINQLQIIWNYSTPALNNTNNCNNLSSTVLHLPSDSSNDPWNCQASLIEASFLPQSALNASSGLTNGQIINQLLTAYLVPNNLNSSNKATGLLSGTQSPLLVNSNCTNNNNNYSCSSTINLPNNSGYYIKLMPLYGPNPTNFNVIPNSVGQSGVTNISSISAQISIDSTGDSNGFLRRIIVRYPVGTRIGYDSFAVQSATSICKEFIANPTGPAYITPGSDVANSNSTDCKTYGF